MPWNKLRTIQGDGEKAIFREVTWRPHNPKATLEGTRVTGSSWELLLISYFRSPTLKKRKEQKPIPSLVLL